MSRDIFEVNLDIIITFHQVNMNETWDESEDGLLTGLQRLEMKGSHNMQDKVFAKAETFLGIHSLLTGDSDLQQRSSPVRV